MGPATVPELVDGRAEGHDSGPLPGATRLGPPAARRRPRPVAGCRREIERIEEGIRGRDESVTGAYGSLRGCLARLAELRAALPTAPSEAMIDRFTVWRSSRLSEGLF